MLIPVNGIEVAVEHVGAGTPLVLVHGFTGSAGDWAGVIDELAADREVITVEHRGHGHSTNTGDAATYSFDQLVADLADVVDALELDRFDLLGHSMGGIVAMRYALLHPERLRSLILMDTGGQASATGTSHDMMRAGFVLAADKGMLAVFDVIAPFLGAGEEGDRARVAVRRSYERMDPVAFTTLGEELLTHPSVLDQLTTLVVPTTVLVGENDNLVGAAEDLHAAIPGSVLAVIPDAGHSPQIENRSAWLGVVAAHLERVA